eukprot:gene1050-1594_t
MASTDNISSTAYLEHLPESEPDRPDLLRPIISLSSFFTERKRHASIGRHPANDVVLNSGRIPLLLGRFHCSINLEIRDGQYVYFLQDKGSNNGCYVGPHMIPKNGKRELFDGSIVSLAGPLNVMREGKVKRNPFRFQFLTGVGSITRPSSAVNHESAEAFPAPRSPRNMEQLLSDMMCSVCHEDV